jgi:hypothetical protein
MDFRWFNVSSKWYRNVRLYNLFNRHANDGSHWWGFGIIQYRKRHLLEES